MTWGELAWGEVSWSADESEGVAIASQIEPQGFAIGPAFGSPTIASTFGG